VESICRAPVEGIVLETFGAGNCPNHRTRFIEILKETTDRGVIIVNCTQCLKGAVIKAYETGKVVVLLFSSISFSCEYTSRP
jgi:lysophospholipase